MSIRIGAGGTIELIGACGSEDAEPLLEHLLAASEATVDWRDCREAHTAVVQVLLAARPKLLGPPANAHLKAWVAPVVTREHE